MSKLTDYLRALLARFYSKNENGVIGHQAMINTSAETTFTTQSFIAPGDGYIAAGGGGLCCLVTSARCLSSQARKLSRVVVRYFTKMKSPQGGLRALSHHLTDIFASQVMFIANKHWSLHFSRTLNLMFSRPKMGMLPFLSQSEKAMVGITPSVVKALMTLKCALPHPLALSNLEFGGARC